jgi:hypothetical protein
MTLSPSHSAIETLAAEAAVAGDLEQVAICDAALGGDAAAIREVARVIAAAAAMGDE